MSRIADNIDRISPLTTTQLEDYSGQVSFDMYTDKYITKKVFISLLRDIGSTKALLLAKNVDLSSSKRTLSIHKPVPMKPSPIKSDFSQFGGRGFH